MRQILESKRRFRGQLAERSFSEKLAILEKLRERSLAIAASPLRARVVSSETGRENTLVNDSGYPKQK
ncbi:MAG: hypothetical protein IPF53_07690 [Blastocatellia bacterium]|nr:hypothetical protein [Blastocatellia bacterium]MBK6429038.1 hypothetical protein [Blastocatellia bacterium]